MREKTHWTLDSYVTHNEALRKSDRRLQKEREKRYNLLDASNKSVLAAALSAAKQADDKAEKVFNEYKVGANEWRDTVKDLIAAQQGGSRGMRDMYGWLIAAVMTGAVLFNLFTK